MAFDVASDFAELVVVVVVVAAAAALGEAECGDAFDDDTDGIAAEDTLRAVPFLLLLLLLLLSALLLLLLATAVIVIVIIFVVVVIARVVCVQEYVPGGKVRIALRSLSVVLLLLLSSIRRRMERILLHSSGRGRRVETSTRENDGYHPVLITVITITTRICCFGES